MLRLVALTLLVLLPCTTAWKSVNVKDFGAVGDNHTDNTKAFRAALLAGCYVSYLFFLSASLCMPYVCTLLVTRLLLFANFLTLTLTTPLPYAMPAVRNYSASSFSFNCPSSNHLPLVTPVKDAGGGHVLVPNGCFRTAPVNLSSNVFFQVEGTMRAIQNRSLFPKIGILPSVGK